MKWNQIIPQLYQVPFKYGGYTLAGMDCVGIVYYYCQQLGKPFPDDFFGTWDGHTIENYGVWEKNTIEQNNALLKGFMEQFGSAVPVKEIIAGDVLLVEIKGQCAFAIYIGNGHIVSVGVGHKVSALSLNSEVRPIMARRL